MDKKKKVFQKIPFGNPEEESKGNTIVKKVKKEETDDVEDVYEEKPNKENMSLCQLFSSARTVHEVTETDKKKKLISVVNQNYMNEWIEKNELLKINDISFGVTKMYNTGFVVMSHKVDAELKYEVFHVLIFWDNNKKGYYNNGKYTQYFKKQPD